MVTLRLTSDDVALLSQIHLVIPGLMLDRTQKDHIATLHESIYEKLTVQNGESAVLKSMIMATAPTTWTIELPDDEIQKYCNVVSNLSLPFSVPSTPTQQYHNDIVLLWQRLTESWSLRNPDQNL